MKVLKACYALLAIACVVSIGAAAYSADEAKKDEPAKEAKKSAEPRDPQAEFNDLDAQRISIAKRLNNLNREFQTADLARQKEIQKEWESSINDYQQKVQPRMIELAQTIFDGDAKKFPFGEFLLQMKMQSNKFADAVAIGDKLAAAGDSSPIVTMVPAVANFALHNFEKAKSALEQVQQDGKLDPQGMQMLKDSAEYIDLWKKEQDIRAAEDMAEGDKANPRVEIKTSRGKIVAELFEDQAPNTVANFISLAEAKTYEGTKFHRVMSNFMIQGGDPNSKDDDPTNDGGGGPGYTIKCECFRDDIRQHFRGSLSMAHTPEKDTGGSQFFITHQPTPHLNGVHTVFGRVLEGQDVVDGVQRGDVIESVTVLRKRNHEYKPEVTKTPDLDEPKEEKKSEEKKTDEKQSEEKKEESK